ncbi:hypothetical protein [Halobaculum lipolyticum]|uniref:Uncharacterized protein n=1 Tax=Halobaculum lipolyticum TaxID=3032001 RepID=A0ABD5WB58_9EURY|nr:hypothetical protein [Halobaculum sp. DT31]
MVLDLGALDAKELVLVAVAVAGLIPAITQRTEGARLFSLGYVLLVFGAVATNLEHVMLGEVLGLLEHVVGIGAAGVVFFLAAYSRRKRILEDDDPTTPGDDAADAVDGTAVADGGEVA